MLFSGSFLFSFVSGGSRNGAKSCFNPRSFFCPPPVVVSYCLLKCILMNSPSYPIKKKKKKNRYYAWVHHPLLEKINNDKVSLSTESMVKKEEQRE